jgi:tRNA dimethylallyltransferase
MQKLLVITGPTNVGKTALAVKLAPKLNGEVISADSRQIYREMNIGTAKPTKDEKKQAVHHLVDFVDPDDEFTLADFQQRAYQAIESISSKGKIPMLVGGTGLYIKAVVDGLKIPKIGPDKNLRVRLEKLPVSTLLQVLRQVDSATANSIPAQNKRRLIRAIEVTTRLGQPFSQVARKHQRQFDTLVVGLNAPREILYARADMGVEEWIKSGWVEEVNRLRKKYDTNLPSMSSIGYREIIQYLEGRITLIEAISLVKFARHAYIRRQLTWLRRTNFVHWFDVTQENWQAEVEKLARCWYSDR